MGTISLEPPPLTKQQIIGMAGELTDEYFYVIGPHKAKLGISFDVMYETVIYPKYEIAFVDDLVLQNERGKEVLGAFDFLENTAFVDACLKPSQHDRRRVFTCWHEVAGHGILHGEWLRARYSEHTSRLVTTADAIEMRPENLFEWQANLFAAHAAAPGWFVDKMIVSTFQLAQPFRYVGPGGYSYCLRSATRNHVAASFHDVCYRIAQYIRPFFGNLSIEALSYRVAESRWVADLSGMETIPTPRPLLRRVAQVA